MVFKSVALIGLAVVLLGAAPAGQAQIYSWTDAQGRKHYGDAASLPPDRAKTIEVKVSQPKTLPPPVDNEGSGTGVTASASASANTKGDTDAPQPHPTQDQKSCEQATSNRDLLADQDKKVVKAGKDGAEDMSDEERKNALDRAKQQVQMYCGG